MAINGLLLGLANGVSCLATCAAVLLPFFLGEGRSVHSNWLRMAQFLVGRLGGYLLFGVLAWALNGLLLQDFGSRAVLFGAAYLVLALLMAWYGLRRPAAACAAMGPGLRSRLARTPWLLPAALGLLTGLNLCPPFLLAFTNAALNASLSSSLLFFLAFFAGTSVYLIPVPFVGALRRMQALQTVGKLASLLMAAYYLYSGFITILQGVLL